MGYCKSSLFLTGRKNERTSKSSKNASRLGDRVESRVGREGVSSTYIEVADDKCDELKRFDDYEYATFWGIVSSSAILGCIIS